MKKNISRRYKWVGFGGSLYVNWPCWQSFIFDKISLPFPSCEKLMERSLIWSQLGRMSKQGLLPIPIDDISAMRTSICETRVTVSGERKLFAQQWSLITSVPFRLLPQKLWDFFCPGVFDVFVHALQSPRVAWFTLPEPNLKLCGGIANVRG